MVQEDWLPKPSEGGRFKFVQREFALPAVGSPRRKMDQPCSALTRREHPGDDEAQRKYGKGTEDSLLQKIVDAPEILNLHLGQHRVLKVTILKT